MLVNRRMVSKNLGRKNIRCHL